MSQRFARNRDFPANTGKPSRRMTPLFVQVEAEAHERGMTGPRQTVLALAGIESIAAEALAKTMVELARHPARPGESIRATVTIERRPLR